jgi:hypothetical protein
LSTQLDLESVLARVEQRLAKHPQSM